MKTNTYTSTFDAEQPIDGFIQLSPIGLFSHARGLQNVDRTALENLVKNFQSFFARLGRRFAGLPFYVGHPDVPGYENTYCDRKAYGWIMDLQAREDGLYGRPKWSAAGRDLIRNGHYKFLSPTWNVEKIGANNGRPVYRPTQLISVGLTNEPNLPVPPLANCDAPEELKTAVGVAMTWMGPGDGQESVPADLTAPGAPEAPSLSGHSPAVVENITPGAEMPRVSSEPVEPARLDPMIDAEHPTASGTADRSAPQISGALPATPAPGVLATEQDPGRHEPPAPAAAAALSHRQQNGGENAFPEGWAALQNAVDNCRRDLAKMEQRLIASILDGAVADGRILPAERNHWQIELDDHFESASAALANTRPRLKRAAVTDNLPRRDLVPPEGAERQRRILALVNERMRSTGASYHLCWLQVRAEHSELF